MQQILDYINKHGQANDEEISNLLGLKKTRTFTITKQMRELGLITISGRGKTKKYLLK